MIWRALTGPMPKTVLMIAAVMITLVGSTVFCEESAQEAATARTPARRALFVGVQDYHAPELSLMGVRDDVRLLADALIARGAFASEDLKVLLDGHATRSNILKTFKEWLIDDTKPGDTVFFHFNGRDCPVWDEKAEDIDAGRHVALIPCDGMKKADAERRTLQGRSGTAFVRDAIENVIPDYELAEMLRQLRGRTVVLICDTSDFVRHVEVEGGALIAFSAAKRHHFPYIVVFQCAPEGHHSVFTWYLLKGFEGKADLNQDGSITFSELARFMEEGIVSGGYQQTPQHLFIPESAGEKTFFTTAPRERVPRAEAEQVQ
ncbi:MAG: caspase family protein [Thermodesulfobacteriota bacterium]